MSSSSRALRRIAFLGSFPPRLCGLATFTADLRDAVSGAAPEAECFALAMTDGNGPYRYPPEVRLEISETDPSSYVRAAEFLNDANVDVLCVQHEFGIYGGAAGGLLLPLLARARMPVVATLHTVLERPNPTQHSVMADIVRRAARLVVMTGRAQEILRAVHAVPPERVLIVPHGIPDTPLHQPDQHKAGLDAVGRTVLLTFGLLSPGKGIEHAIRALPAIVAHRPDALYVVLGATHPNLRRREGEAYRHGLVRLAAELGVAGHVRFLDRFVDLPALTRAIAATDIYLTPYLNQAQSVSGTLAYSYGMGKPVVSTPYWHAAELLADGRGRLVPFAQPAAIADAVLGLLDDPVGTRALSVEAYRIGRESIWPRIGQRYLAAFCDARSATLEHREQIAAASIVAVSSVAPLATGLGPARHGELLPPSLDHLASLLDSTGIAQHATHAVVDRAHGYCLDDNARGLLLSVMLPRLPAAGRAPATAELFARTAAFVQHAWNGPAGRFRNFMAFDRRWLEEFGSEDSHARAVWALGAVVRYSEGPQPRAWAYDLLERATKPVAAFTSPRAWAFALLGTVDYLDKRPEDLRFVALRAELAERLRDHLRGNRCPGWTWFEDILSYDNARLAQALVAAGRQACRDDWQVDGLKALEWLCGVQTASAGHFRPIGSDGFWRRGGERALFDQQPLEAGASVAACLEAWRATRSLRWLAESRRAYDWFMGSNDLGEPVWDAVTGGCRDGLLCDRVNANQGAESTLSFWLAAVELRAALAEASLPGAQLAAMSARRP